MSMLTEKPSIDCTFLENPEIFINSSELDNSTVSKRNGVKNNTIEQLVNAEVYRNKGEQHCTDKLMVEKKRKGKLMRQQKETDEQTDIHIEPAVTTQTHSDTPTKMQANGAMHKQMMNGTTKMNEGARLLHHNQGYGLQYQQDGSISSGISGISRSMYSDRVWMNSSVTNTSISEYIKYTG